MSGLYLSLVQWEDDDGLTLSTLRDPTPQGRFKTSELPLVFPDGKFELKGTKAYPDEFSLTTYLTDLSKRVPLGQEALFFIHARQDVRADKKVQLVTLSSGKPMMYKTVLNPLWSGAQGVRRNISSVFLEPDVSLAMQSQLFAMLDADRADARWMQEYSLRDIYQQTMYSWQHANLPAGNIITPDRMVTIMKNVLNVIRLPWIPLHFTDKGDSCFFKVSFDGPIDKKNTGASGFSWLHEPKKSSWEIMGHYDKSPKIKIERMELYMLTKWGLNTYILLHELAHYCAFCLPLPSKLSKGDFRLSFTQYEMVFSAHGMLYMGVFRYLLITFAKVNPAWLDASLNESKVKYLNINKFTVQDFEAAIAKEFSIKIK